MIRSLRGFTLVELLMVITIICILAGLLIPGLGILKRKQREAETLRLMNEMQYTLSVYLSTYPLLGEPPALTFEDQPWEFLGLRQLRLDEKPMLNLPAKYLATSTGSSVVKAIDGILIRDAFRMPFVWATINLPAGTPRYSNGIALVSQAGTKAFPKDDLIMIFTNNSGAWRKMTWAEIVSTSGKATKTIDEQVVTDLKAIWELKL
jgi:prepilin-type N-terminal cleavage/methylation domain-containing protein